MTHHLVDPTERSIESDDLATWLLFFLESHGATVALTPAQHVHVDLNTMPGLDAAIVGRWAPIIATLSPEFRTILLARVAPQNAPLDGKG